MASDVLSERFSQGEPFQEKNQLIVFIVENTAGRHGSPPPSNGDSPREIANGGIIKR